MLELDELIAIMEYKEKNIKAHVSASTFKQIAEILKKYKELCKGDNHGADR